MDEKAAAETSRPNPTSAAPTLADSNVAGSNSKEEGELSCSDDGNYDLCVATQPVRPTAPLRTRLVSGPVNGAGRRVPGNPPVIGLQQVSQMHLRDRKNSMNSNLVIEFSDDESESSSDNDGLDRSSKGRTLVTAPVKFTPPASVQLSAKASILAIPRKRPEVPKILPSNHPFPRPIMNTQGARIQGSMFSGQGKAGQRSCLVSHKFENRGVNNNSGSSTGQLQDLRQQIAKRENELRLRTSQHLKQFSSESSSHSPALNATAVGNLAVKSAEVSQRGSKEPPRKKLKVGGPRQTQQGLQQDMAGVKSRSPRKDLLLLGNGSEGNISHVEKGPDKGKGESTLSKSRGLDTELMETSQSERNGVQTGSADQLKQRSQMVNALPYAHQHSLSSMTIANPLVEHAANFELELNLDSVKKVGKDDPRESSFDQAGRNYITCTFAGDPALEYSSMNPAEGALRNFSKWDSLGNDAKDGNEVMQSLVEMEEDLDKKLEDAQEQRRICEIEERNALKAYRKAQRALLEANARCANLYRERELYSSRVRSLVMDNSILMWPYASQEVIATRIDSSNNMLTQAKSVPSSSHLVQEEYNQSNQPVHPFSLGPGDASNHNTVARGLSIGMAPNSKPDSNTSTPLRHKGSDIMNSMRSSSHDPTLSAEEVGEVFPPARYPPRDEKLFQGEREVSRATQDIPNDNSSDFLLLEAALRSQLYARWGTNNSQSLKGSSGDGEPMVERGCKSDDGNGEIYESDASPPQDTGKSEQHAKLVPALIKDKFHVEKPSIKPSEASCNEGSFVRESQAACALDFLSNGLFRSTFQHVMDISCMGSHQLSQRDHVPQFINDGMHMGGHEKSKEIDPLDLSRRISQDLSEAEATCGGGNVAVEPFWPLCMYELRGKCNDDACPWQHLQDSLRQDVSCLPQRDSKGFADIRNVCLNADAAGCPDDLAKSGTEKNQSKCRGPKYVIGLDVLKANACYERIVAWRRVQCWQKCFSTYLVITSHLRQGLDADYSVLQNEDGRLESFGFWGRRGSCFQNMSKNVTKEAIADGSYTLETALLLLNQGVNKIERTLRGLALIENAVKNDPTSVVHWVMYLTIYYGTTKNVRDDDLYATAVKHVQGSYELWLLYINSRTKFVDRVKAYEDALSLICQQFSASNGDRMQNSACILDLFLQMVYFFCTSGNTQKAIQIIDALIPSVENSDERFVLLLTCIISCLTTADKCIFWICCVYIVIYRKLPDYVVAQLECGKELVLIDWPSVDFNDDDRQRALQLVELAVQQFESYMLDESVNNEDGVRVAPRFALNHFWCMMALDGLQSSRNLLIRYTAMFPNSLELLLLSARANSSEFSALNFASFEEAILDWPENVPGIQCIWNQYVQCVLQSGSPDLAKEIMVRWFSCEWKTKFLVVDLAYQTHSDILSRSIPTSHMEGAVSSSSRLDEMFGFLNFSLYSWLHQQYTEARVAADKALKLATHETIKHCIKEHAKLLLVEGSVPQDGAHLSKLLGILRTYLDCYYQMPRTEPLSKKFIEDVSKPRLRELIKDVFCPVSSDFYVVNIVLEAWWGPSLLPQKFCKVKDLVDLVEAVIDISPANYHLAICVVKYLTNGYNSKDVASASLFYWAGSLLVSTLSHAVPVAPESVWVEAAEALENAGGVDTALEGFYRKALLAYPFSKMLWKLSSRILPTENGCQP